MKKEQIKEQTYLSDVKSYEVLKSTKQTKKAENRERRAQNLQMQHRRRNGDVRSNE